MMQSESVVPWNGSQVYLNCDLVTAVKNEVERQSLHRILIVHSMTIANKSNYITSLSNILGDRLVATFTDIQQHSPRFQLIQLIEVASESNVDGVIGFGGGSLIDLVKILPLALANDVKSENDVEKIRPIDPLKFQIPESLRAPKLPIILIPTTLSGGAFFSLAGCTDTSKNEKQPFYHPKMVPSAIILDAQVTSFTPEWLWLSTGVRAVDHAVETLGSLKSNMFCDDMAKCALKNLVTGLLKCKEDMQNLDARKLCLLGHWQSMIPIVAGVPMGGSHAIGHVLGGLCKVPHGYTSCVMMPAVLEHNRKVNAERQKAIDMIMSGIFQDDQPAPILLDKFLRQLGMPRSLADVGVLTEDQLTAVSKSALNDFWAKTNPIPLENAEEVMKILKMVEQPPNK